MTCIISIIIPVYNVAPYLRECLESVLSQSCGDWEAICVDDGSTDGSGAILDEYALSDSRIRVVHQPNAGVVAARQAGFKVSNGNRILFLDADDTLSQNALERLCGVPAEVEMAQFGFRYILAGKEIRVCRPAVTGQFTRNALLEKISNSPLELIGMCIGNKCYSRDVVEGAFSAVGHVQIPHSEDGLFALAAFWVSARVAFYNDVIYNYRFRAESASHVFNPDIVATKEAFVSAATRLARNVGGQSECRCSVEFNYHARQSMGYVFMMAMDGRLQNTDARRLLQAMSGSSFFINEKSTWNPNKRLLMRMLIKSPSVTVWLRGLIRFCVKRFYRLRSLLMTMAVFAMS